MIPLCKFKSLACLFALVVCSVISLLCYSHAYCLTFV